MTFILVALVVLKYLAATALLVLGGAAIYDCFRREPKIPDPVLAIINLVGYLSLIALALVIVL